MKPTYQTYLLGEKELDKIREVLGIADDEYITTIEVYNGQVRLHTIHGGKRTKSYSEEEKTL